MFIKLIEIYRTSATSKRDRFQLKETFVNTEHVSKVTDASVQYSSYLKEGLLPEGLDERTQFAILYINTGNSMSETVVVGNKSTIVEKITAGEKKQILKG